MLFLLPSFDVFFLHLLLFFVGIITGFFSLSMPAVFLSLRYISPLYYGSYVLSNLVFFDVEFSCSDSSNDNCFYSDGNQVLSAYNFSDRNGQYGYNFHYVMLAVSILFYLLVTLVGFRWSARSLVHRGRSRSCNPLKLLSSFVSTSPLQKETLGEEIRL